MNAENILKVFTAYVRKTKGTKEAFLFFVNYVQPIVQYFKNDGDINFEVPVESIESDFKPGQQYRMCTSPFRTVKIHITHVLPSVYEEALVVYKYYSIVRRRWVECMEADWWLKRNIVKQIKK